jgi:flagellar biosynthesis GTPase FlhF
MSTVTDNEPRTYRGADLEELLPKIRAELGPDAVVLRQRDGLEGGIGGFFRRRCVEVVARRGAPGLDLYDDGPAATIEPPAPAVEPPAPAMVPQAQAMVPPARAMVPPARAVEPQAPAIREIMRMASPFVEQLQAAQAQVEPLGHVGEPPAWAPEPQPPRRQPRAPYPRVGAAEPQALALALASHPPPAEPLALERQLRAPQPQLRAPQPQPRATEPQPRATEPQPRVPEPQPRATEPQSRASEPEPVAPGHPPEPEPPAPEPAALTGAPATESAPRAGAAATHERALVAAGIAPALVAEILAATISHGVPFARTRPLKHLLRDALAERIPTAPPVAPGRRTIAFVGPGGAGKTLCASRLAAAYAAGSDLDVRVLNLAGGLLEPAAGPVLTIVDTPTVSPAAGAKAVAALARQLRRFGPVDVHVVVPATFSAAAVRRLLDGLAPMQPAAIVLTHLDEVDHAGPALNEAIARGLALSYCSDVRALAPVDPSALAARVLA